MYKECTASCVSAKWKSVITEMFLRVLHKMIFRRNKMNPILGGKKVEKCHYIAVSQIFI